MIFQRLFQVTVLALILSLSGFSSVLATDVTNFKDTLSRLKISATSTQEIEFITPSGVTASSDNIVITFPSGWALPTTGLDFDDMDLAVSNTSSCTGFSDETLAASATTGVWGVGVVTSTRVITFTPPTDATSTVPAGYCVQIQIGTNAAGSPDTNITNPSATGTKVIVLSGDFNDDGKCAVIFLSNEQVVVTATVNPTISFSLDSNSADLGTLSTASVATSTTTLTTSTNAEHGLVVTIQADHKLRIDVSNDIDDIGEATVTADTEGYGIALAADASLTEEGNFASDDSSVPTTATNMMSCTGVLSSVNSTVTYRAAIGSTTAAGDYTQTVTYIATGTF